MNKEKILFIPGWMDKGEIRGFSNSLDIWTEKMNLNRKLDENIIVAHSAGVQMALLNWEKNKNSKLILCGPMFPHRGFFGWASKWLKFAVQEGTKMSKERTKLLIHLITGVRVLFKMLKIDALAEIKKIPKDNVTIIRGTEDIHFCNKETADNLKEEGYRVIEVKGAGHNWNKGLANALDKYLNEKR